MNRVMLGVITILILTAYFTSRIFKPSNTSVVMRHENIVRTVVPKIVENNLGTKQDLVDLATNDIVRYIHEKVGLQVIRITKNESEPVTIVMARPQAADFIVIKIKTLKVISQKADLTLELAVFNNSNTKIYDRTVTSHGEEPTDDKEKIVETVVKDALKKLVKDPELRKIMARFKYGIISKASKIS